jgi:hypothetical protein
MVLVKVDNLVCSKRLLLVKLPLWKKIRKQGNKTQITKDFLRETCHLWVTIVLKQHCVHGNNVIFNYLKMSSKVFNMQLFALMMLIIDSLTFSIVILFEFFKIYIDKCIVNNGLLLCSRLNVDSGSY